MSEQTIINYDSRAIKVACKTISYLGYCTKCDKRPPCAAAKTILEEIIKEFSEGYKTKQPPKEYSSEL